MSELEWFADDFKLVDDFQIEVLPLLSSIEALNEAIHKLEEAQKALQQEIIDATYKESKTHVLAHTIKTLEQEAREKKTKLQQVKESFLQEDIVGSLEILTSADGGAEISEEACELMKKVNAILR